MRASIVIVSMVSDCTTYDAEIDSRKPNRPTVKLTIRSAGNGRPGECPGG